MYWRLSLPMKKPCAHFCIIFCLILFFKFIFPSFWYSKELFVADQIASTWPTFVPNLSVICNLMYKSYHVHVTKPPRTQPSKLNPRLVLLYLPCLEPGFKVDSHQTFAKYINNEFKQHCDTSSIKPKPSKGTQGKLQLQTSLPLDQFASCRPN